MKRKPILILLALVVLTLFIANATSTHAQSGGTYELTWSTLDGGGATSSTGGTYSLDGTIGQPDAGTMSGGTYSLGGGFWGFAANVVNTVNKIFLPLISK
jgi:uncharacterized membrane protein